MDDLLQEFISETQETLEALAGEVVAWEADPSDSARLDAIFRFFHTVKGSCGFLNLPRFERLSHAAEDVLSEIRQGNRVADPGTVSAVLAIMDRIGELSEAVAAGAALPSENDEALIHGLNQLPALGDDAEMGVVVDGGVAAANTGVHFNSRTIRLPLALIDQLMNGVSDMVLARNELSRKLRERFSDPDLESSFDRLSTCVADMRDAISKTRMQRVDRLFIAIPRMVRDLCRDLGKRVELHLEGRDVEMDREMVEMVIDPLMHIVRNSVDHGIELPDVRRAAGKPETGSLRLAARQSGNQIVIEIVDDGRGIDTQKLVDKAIATGALTPEAASKLSESAKLDLIFAAGLSTAEKITSISGRGVGMDVVRANIERIGGVISLDNAPGRGLKIILRVPLTLTIIPGLVVRAGRQQFAIPQAAVSEILHDNNQTLSISHVGGARVATIRSIRHSMVDLEDILGVEKAVIQGPRTIMVVRSALGVPFALGVEAVENHEELVIRPAAPIIMASGIYAGMTLPDNGQPMLLLDAGGLAQAAEIPVTIDEVAADKAAADQANAAAADMVSALRFIARSGEERLLKLSLVERVEDIDRALFGRSDGRAFVRIDDRLLPVVGEHVTFEEEQVTSLRLRSGDQEICYPVESVLDIVQMPVEPQMRMTRGGLSGVALIGDEHLEVVDPFALFASVPDETITPRTSGRCVIANPDDPWAQEILVPLLRQAGHAIEMGVGAEGDLNEHDVVLCTQLSNGLPKAANLITLRQTPRAQGPDDCSIYRYDRDALMSAIDALQHGRKAG